MEDTFSKEYKELTQRQSLAVVRIKDAAEHLLHTIEYGDEYDRSNLTPYPEGSREKSIAKTKLEEVVMWATKHWTKTGS